LRPVDPLTLGDLPGYRPLTIGPRRWQTSSPDGTTLALFVDDDLSARRIPGSARSSRLQLIDLTSWQIRTTPILVSGELGWAGFAPDGRTLYWLVFAGNEDSVSAQRAYTLYRYRLGTPEAEALTTLPPGVIGEEIRQSHSGNELLVYRIAGGQTSPQLDFLDLTSGHIVATL
jgi:hypothetical protein